MPSRCDDFEALEEDEQKLKHLYLTTFKFQLFMNKQVI
jgi:hypothetical protein